MIAMSKEQRDRGVFRLTWFIVLFIAADYIVGLPGWAFTLFMLASALWAFRLMAGKMAEMRARGEGFHDA